MNENELYVVKEYKFENPVIAKIDSIIDSCHRDCHNKFFHTLKYECIYHIKLTNITNYETINLKISDKSMNLYEINEKITVARQNGFLFNQINKLTMKIYSNLQIINICYFLKFRIPICHRLFFRRISQNKKYIENFCNDLNNPFDFACRKWYLYYNPQSM